MFILIKKVPEFSLVKKKFNFLTILTFIILTVFKTFVITSWDFRYSYLNENKILNFQSRTEQLVSSFIYINLTYFYPFYMPYELIVTNLRAKNPEKYKLETIDSEIARYKSLCERSYERNPYNSDCDNFYAEMMIEPRYKDIWFEQYFKKMIDLSIFQMKRAKFDDSGYLAAIKYALKYGKITKEEYQNYLYDGCLKYNSYWSCNDGLDTAVDTLSEDLTYNMFLKTCILGRSRCTLVFERPKWNLIACEFEKNKEYPCPEDQWQNNFNLHFPKKDYSKREIYLKTLSKDYTKFLEDIEKAKKEVLQSEYGELRKGI